MLGYQKIRRAFLFTSAFTWIVFTGCQPSQIKEVGKIKKAAVPLTMSSAQEADILVQKLGFISPSSTQNTITLPIAGTGVATVSYIASSTSLSDLQKIKTPELYYIFESTGKSPMTAKQNAAVTESLTQSGSTHTLKYTVTFPSVQNHNQYTTVRSQLRGSIELKPGVTVKDVKLSEHALSFVDGSQLLPAVELQFSSPLSCPEEGSCQGTFKAVRVPNNKTYTLKILNSSQSVVDEKGLKTNETHSASFNIDPGTHSFTAKLFDESSKEQSSVSFQVSKAQAQPFGLEITSPSTKTIEIQTWDQLAQIFAEINIPGTGQLQNISGLRLKMEIFKDSENRATVTRSASELVTKTTQFSRTLSLSRDLVSRSLEAGTFEIQFVIEDGNGKIKSTSDTLTLIITPEEIKGTLLFDLGNPVRGETKPILIKALNYEVDLPETGQFTFDNKSRSCPKSSVDGIIVYDCGTQSYDENKTYAYSFTLTECQATWGDCTVGINYAPQSLNSPGFIEVRIDQPNNSHITFNSWETNPHQLVYRIAESEEKIENAEWLQATNEPSAPAYFIPMGGTLYAMVIKPGSAVPPVQGTGRYVQIAHYEESAAEFGIDTEYSQASLKGSGEVLNIKILNDDSKINFKINNLGSDPIPSVEEPTPSVTPVPSVTPTPTPMLEVESSNCSGPDGRPQHIVKHKTPSQIESQGIRVISYSGMQVYESLSGYDSTSKKYKVVALQYTHSSASFGFAWKNGNNVNDHINLPAMNCTTPTPPESGQFGTLELESATCGDSDHFSPGGLPLYTFKYIPQSGEWITNIEVLTDPNQFTKTSIDNSGRFNVKSDIQDRSTLTSLQIKLTNNSAETKTYTYSNVAKNCKSRFTLEPSCSSGKTSQYTVNFQLESGETLLSLYLNDNNDITKGTSIASPCVIKNSDEIYVSSACNVYGAQTMYEAAQYHFNSGDTLYQYYNGQYSDFQSYQRRFIANTKKSNAISTKMLDVKLGSLNCQALGSCGTNQCKYGNQCHAIKPGVTWKKQFSDWSCTCTDSSKTYPNCVTCGQNQCLNPSDNSCHNTSDSLIKSSDGTCGCKYGGTAPNNCNSKPYCPGTNKCLYAPRQYQCMEVSDLNRLIPLEGGDYRMQDPEHLFIERNNEGECQCILGGTLVSNPYQQTQQCAKFEFKPATDTNRCSGNDLNPQFILKYLPGSGTDQVTQAEWYNGIFAEGINRNIQKITDGMDAIISYNGSETGTNLKTGKSFNSTKLFRATKIKPIDLKVTLTSGTVKTIQLKPDIQQDCLPKIEFDRTNVNQNYAITDSWDNGQTVPSGGAFYWNTVSNRMQVTPSSGNDHCMKFSLVVKNPVTQLGLLPQNKIPQNIIWAFSPSMGFYSTQAKCQTNKAQDMNYGFYMNSSTNPIYYRGSIRNPDQTAIELEFRWGVDSFNETMDKMIFQRQN